AANRRLARMLCGDLETTTQQERHDLARQVHFGVFNRVALAMSAVILRRLGRRPPCQVIASGSGEVLVPAVLSSTLFKVRMEDCPIISLGKQLDPNSSEAACAVAVAVLCKESLPT